MPKRVGEDEYVPPHLHNAASLRLAAPDTSSTVGMSWTPLEIEPYVLSQKGWSTDPGFSPPTPGVYLYFLAFDLFIPGTGTLRATVSDDVGLSDALDWVVEGEGTDRAVSVRHSGVAVLDRFPARAFLQCDEHACQVRVSNFRLDLVRLGGFR